MPRKQQRSATKVDMRNAMRLASLVLLFMVIVIAGEKLLQRSLYEFRGPDGWDSHLFWAVGRGILNGKTLYADLFETKPPGIFLVSAASLLLSEGRMLGQIASSCCVLFIGLIPALILSEKKSGMRGLNIYIALITALSFFLAVFAAERSGEYTVEIFGAPFAIAYVTYIANKETLRIPQIILCGLLIAASAFFKEPFVLSIIGAAIIVRQSLRSLISTLLLPLFASGIFFLLALAASGALWGYISIYLPEIFGARVNTDGNVLLKGISIAKWTSLLREYALYNPYFAFVCTSLFGYSACLLMPKINKLTTFVAATALGGYFITLSISMGGSLFYPQHYVFSLPGALAIGIVGTNAMKRRHGEWDSIVMALAVGALLLVGASKIYSPNYDEMFSHNKWLQMKGVAAAAKIDEILDACNESTYLFLGPNGPHPSGYTKHSPIGPLFFQYAGWLDHNHSYFRAKFKEQLSRANLIIDAGNSELNDLTNPTWEYIGKNFTTAPWPCAGDATTEGYVLHFRNERHSLSSKTF
jgi:hypothetical protein